MIEGRGMEPPKYPIDGNPPETILRQLLLGFRGAEPVEPMASSPLHRQQEDARGDDQQIGAVARQPWDHLRNAGEFKGEFLRFHLRMNS